MTEFNYVGNELEIFKHAKNWKTYYKSVITPFLGERILEVGAGIGATTVILHNESIKEWVCLEPDINLKNVIDERIQAHTLPPNCKTRLGTVQSLKKDETFDTILYIDVVEHIEQDGFELNDASEHLNPGGSLIVLSPAHQWLFTPFDQAIGHYRRYSKESLLALSPVKCKLEKLVYLDSVGMFLSLANRLLLQQSMPTVNQIKFWDSWIVPISKKIDAMLRFSVGKSVLGIWVRK